jgi:hypothetical protein
MGLGQALLVLEAGEHRNRLLDLVPVPVLEALLLVQSQEPETADGGVHGEPFVAGLGGRLGQLLVGAGRILEHPARLLGLGERRERLTALWMVVGQQLDRRPEPLLNQAGAAADRGRLPASAYRSPALRATSWVRWSRGASRFR